MDGHSDLSETIKQLVTDMSELTNGQTDSSETLQQLKIRQIDLTNKVDELQQRQNAGMETNCALGNLLAEITDTLTKALTALQEENKAGTKQREEERKREDKREQEQSQNNGDVLPACMLGVGAGCALGAFMAS